MTIVIYEMYTNFVYVNVYYVVQIMLPLSACFLKNMCVLCWHVRFILG
jgi:hypothetical protein